MILRGLHGALFAAAVIAVQIRTSDAGSNKFIPLSTKSRYEMIDSVDAVPVKCEINQVQLVGIFLRGDLPSRRLVRCMIVTTDIISPTVKLSRHGTRNPTEENIYAFRNLSLLLSDFTLERVLDQVVDANYSWLPNWQNPYELSDQGMLVPAGRQDMEFLAQRARKRYPALLSVIDASRVLVTSTAIPRAFDSADAFLQELVEPDYIQINMKPRFADPELRPFDSCPLFQCPTCAGRKDGQREYERFAKDKFTEVAERLNKLFKWKRKSSVLRSLNALRFHSKDPKSSLQWTPEMVNIGMQVCAFQLAIDMNYDQWCSLFKPHELSYYDYATDLEMYHSYSYGGRPITQNLACTLLTNITATFHDDYLQAHLRFAHAETLVPLLTTMGIFKPETHLNASWTDAQRRERIWKGSYLSPFGANMWFERAKCSDSTQKIRVLLHEQPVTFPQCKDGQWCTIEEWTNMFQTKLGCDLSEMCRLTR